MAKSCGVSSNREFCIVRVGDKSPLAIRSESVIETVILRVLSYQLLVEAVDYYS